jgi:hypothetical protein
MVGSMQTQPRNALSIVLGCCLVAVLAALVVVIVQPSPAVQPTSLTAGTPQQGTSNVPATEPTTVNTPTSLGANTAQEDRAVESNLTNAMTIAKAAYANSGTYATTATAEVGSLRSAAPAMTFGTAAAPSGTDTLSVTTSTDGQELLLVGSSESGQCWAISDNEGTATAIRGGPGASAEGVEYTNWTRSSTDTCDQTGAVAAAPKWRNSY